jgi:hypothetical protein
MRDPGVGRVLLASLHQGIADILPTRLGFYESWLHAKGLRDGTIDLAPLYAVLSFLRQEGDVSYRKITTSAGEYAAEWTIQSMGGFERWLIRAAPNWLRNRLVLRLADRLVRDTYRRGRLFFKMRKNVATQSDVDSAKTVGIIGVVVGAIALIVALVALFMRRRAT